MARSIVVNFNGETSEFGLNRLTREKLYGRKVRVVVDEEGNETDTAFLTRDGSTLLLKGSTASVYINDNYEVTERSELTAVDAEGEPLPSIGSTLGVEQELRGPIDPRRVLDHNVKAVYELDPESLDDDLRAQLEEGAIFEVDFVYRSASEPDPMFLLQNDEGIFGILGEETKFEFLRKAQVAPQDDDDDDPFDDDDLDFSMM